MRIATWNVNSLGARLGRVEESDGTGYSFHATAIADGSRDIEVDAAVAFTVTPGHRGQFEARALTPIASA